MATEDPILSISSSRINSGTISLTSVAFAVFGSVGDPEGTRTVTSIVALLVALGVALVMLAVWLHRSTRPDPELLAPLEMMGDRKWRRADPVWQRRRLDEIRPRGAMPMEPSIAPPAIDKAFDEGPSAPGFDDLHGVGIPSHDGSSPSTEADLPWPVAGERVADADTPPALKRPIDIEFEDGDVDPEVLAAAMAELDAELGRDRP